MSNIEKLGETKLNGVITNIFSKESITSISVYYRKRMFDLGWIAEGTVKFKNGNTEASQSFEGSSFDDVTQKIKTFIENEL
jgi:hypothetical protein